MAILVDVSEVLAHHPTIVLPCALILLVCTTYALLQYRR